MSSIFDMEDGDFLMKMSDNIMMTCSLRFLWHQTRSGGRRSRKYVEK